MLGSLVGCDFEVGGFSTRHRINIEEKTTWTAKTVRTPVNVEAVRQSVFRSPQPSAENCDFGINPADNTSYDRESDE